MFICSFFVAFVYFGEVINSEILLVNQYMGMLVSALLDIIGALIGGYMMSFWSRKRIIKWSGYIGCILAVCIALM